MKGKEVMEIYGAKAGGPFIQQALDRVFILYAVNRNLTKEDLIKDVSDNKDKYTI